MVFVELKHPPELDFGPMVVALITENDPQIEVSFDAVCVDRDCFSVFDRSPARVAQFIEGVPLIVVDFEEARFKFLGLAILEEESKIIEQIGVIWVYFEGSPILAFSPSLSPSATPRLLRASISDGSSSRARR